MNLLNKITHKKALFVIVSFLLITLLAALTVPGVVLDRKMERAISEALDFVHEQEENLNVIQEIQKRLFYIGYRIQLGENNEVGLNEYTYYPDGKSLGAAQSFIEYKNLSEKEKDAILEVIYAIPGEKIYFTIEPKQIMISSDTIFGFSLFYFKTITVYIYNDNDDFFDGKDRKRTYYEKISNWSIYIEYWEND